ncbi:MAG: histone deacetylase [Psychroflexus sp.]|nr:histone deacetylase [Psychroflexus sp.]MDN6317791.1 histone deacetylase [Lactococcus lactis]
MLKIAFHPCYQHPLKANHRFPMEKYDLIPKQLRLEGICNPEHFFEPTIETSTEKYIQMVHSQAYLDAMYNLKLDRKAIRKIGFPLSEALVKRERLITNATLQATKFALQNGVGMNIAGGTHHAFPDHGEGFCMINDQATASYFLLEETQVEKILIIDLDVHQGNGTAAVFQNEPRVFTFSMHGKSNYPFKKEKSDLDIPLENGCNDATYLSVLKEHLPALMESVKPDFVFYLSGVDILETDKLGKLSCSVEGCRQRDAYVLNLIKEHQLPLEISMGGGYSKDIKHIINAHTNTYRLVQDLFFI